MQYADQHTTDLGGSEEDSKPTPPYLDELEMYLISKKYDGEELTPEIIDVRWASGAQASVIALIKVVSRDDPSEWYLDIWAEQEGAFKHLV